MINIETEKMWAEYGKLQAKRELLYTGIKETEKQMRQIYQQIQTIEQEGKKDGTVQHED